MTRYLRWGIVTRLSALFGFLIAILSQWVEPLASSIYSNLLLVIGFVLAFLGVCAGKGMFFFKGIYKQLEQEELERKN